MLPDKMFLAVNGVQKCVQGPCDLGATQVCFPSSVFLYPRPNRSQMARTMVGAFVS